MGYHKLYDQLPVIAQLVEHCIAQAGVQIPFRPEFFLSFGCCLSNILNALINLVIFITMCQLFLLQSWSVIPLETGVNFWLTWNVSEILSPFVLLFLDWLEQNSLQRVVMVITQVDTEEVLERWQFDIQCEKTGKGATGDNKQQPKKFVFCCRCIALKSYHVFQVIGLKYCKLQATTFEARCGKVGGANRSF